MKWSVVKLFGDDESNVGWLFVVALSVGSVRLLSFFFFVYWLKLYARHPYAPSTRVLACSRKKAFVSFHGDKNWEFALISEVVGHELLQCQRRISRYRGVYHIETFWPIKGQRGTVVNCEWLLQALYLEAVVARNHKSHCPALLYCRNFISDPRTNVPRKSRQVIRSWNLASWECSTYVEYDAFGLYVFPGWVGSWWNLR